MTRGIHLKRLTDSDLGLLGLSEPEQDAVDTAEQDPRADHEHTPNSTPSADDQRPVHRAAPPQNPRIPLDAAAHGPVSGQDADAPPTINLAAVTREICVGLEETLRLLEGSSFDHGGA